MKRSSLFFAYRLACSRENNNLIASVLLVILSFLPLVVVLQVTKTMEQGIMHRYLETSSYHFKIFPMGKLYPSEDDLEKVQKDIEKVIGVKNVVIEKNKFGLALSKFGREGILLRGLEEDFYIKDDGMRSYLKFSELVMERLERGSVFIGEFLAKKLKLKLNDNIKIITFSPENRVPIIRTLKVNGIFSVGYYELDKGWVLANKDDYQLFSGNEGRNIFLGVKTADPFGNYRQIGKRIQNILPFGWFIWDWKSLNTRNIENFRITNLLLFFIFGLMVCVGVVMNASSLYIFFLSRRREIALLKALGFPPDQIRNIFIFLGFLVGLIGIVGGLVVGSLITMNMQYLFKMWLWVERMWYMFVSKGIMDYNISGQESFYLYRFTTHFKAVTLLWTGFGILIWSSFVNFFPSSQISKMKVLEILRKL